jgi:vitamin B12 transporter
MRSLPLSLAVPLALAPFAMAMAQPAPSQVMPDTIVTATGIPSPAARVPSGVTVITRQEIEDFGYQTLAEALQTVPGMRVVQTGGIGQQASGFLRGSNSRHVLVLYDGVPVNDPAEPNGAFNFGNELLGDIERIEVVRGPGSSLYGSGAIGGVINLISRRAPANTPFQAFGDLAGGTQGTGRGTLGAAGTTSAWDYLFVGQGYVTQGSDATPQRFNNDTRETEDFRAGAGTARLGWNPAPGTRIEGLLRWRENRNELDNVPNDDPNYTGNDRRWYGQLRAETTLFGAWNTGLRAAVTEDRRRYVNLPDSGSRATTDDLFRGQRQTLDWGNRVALGDLGPVTGLGLAFGATFEDESVDAASGSTSFRTTTNASAQSTALRAGLQGQLAERLDLSAAIRRDASEDYDGYTSWLAGAVLQVPELQSRLRLSAGTAFKAPSLFQRFGRIGTTFRGNPDLAPESSFSWEARLETDLPMFGRPDGATGSVTYFNSRFQDLINFNARFNSLENVESATARGFELGLTMRPATWLDARLAWTITEARDQTRDIPLPRRPRNVVAVSARIAPTERFVIAPEVLYTGPSPESAFAAYDNTGRSFTQLTYNKGGTVLNITASYRVTAGITGYVEGRNLTGSDYEPANGFVIPGRSLLAGARFIF